MYKFVRSGDQMKILGDTSRNNFIEILKVKWDELHNQSDAFRYRIDNLQERLVNDRYLLQLNPDRGSKRRTPENIENVCQPFDKDKFNFTKVSAEEILFDLFRQGNESDIHSLIVNVSPISRYHSLLCPSLSECHPQILTEASLEVALDIMFFAKHRDLRIGFNSLCALASVNHLHYHIFLEPNTLPVESAKCEQIKGTLFCVEDYPTPAFCFQVTSPESVKNTCKEIYKLISYFRENSIAHNLFITRGESLVPGDNENEVVRVIIWPRKSSAGAKQMDAFNVAVCELSGWFPVYDKTAFGNLTIEDLEQELKKWKFDNFHVLCEKVKTMF